ncbi:MAG: type II secretion system F family protein [Phycisphaeraceae bacterium]
MAQFQYIARTNTGERVNGVLEAATEAAAVRALDEKSLFPVKVTEQAQPRSQQQGPRIKTRELSAIFEQLGDLLKAGVPLLRALETLTRTNSNPRVVRVIRQVADDVSSGKALEESMGRQPTVFNSLQCAMVRAGERGGFLESVLFDLSAYLERQDELRSKVRGAMIYPVILVFVGFAVVTGCLVYMVPQFKPLFANLSLPLPSRILFAASDAISTYLPITLAGILLSVIAIAMYMKTAAGQNLWNKVMLAIPVVGLAVRMVAVTRFCRVLGTMLGSGVPMLQALAISRDAAGLPPLSVAIDEAIESVRHGNGLTPPMKKYDLIPAQTLEMIAVAEESNQLEKVLLKIADTVERRTNRQVDSAVRLLEPVILILLAGVILFVALGLLYPIFSMSSTIR